MDIRKKDPWPRLNLRIDPETYRRLEQKRLHAGYKKQALGEHLVKQWLNDDRTAEENHMIDRLIHFLRTNDSEGMRNVLDSILQPQKKVRNLKSG